MAVAEPQRGMLRALLKHWLWSLVWQNRRAWSMVLLASLLLNLFALALPFYTMAIYDRILPTQSLPSLTALTLGIVLIFCFEFSVRFLRGLIATANEQRIDDVLGRRLFAALSSHNVRDGEHNAANALSIMQSHRQVRRFLSRATMLAIGDLPFALFILGMIVLFAGWQMAAWPLAAAVLLIITARALHLWQAQRATGDEASIVQRNTFMHQVFNGLETTRCSASDSFLSRQWQDLQAAQQAQEGYEQQAQEFGQNMAQLLRNCAVAGLLVTGVYQVIAGALSAGALIACMMLVQRVLLPVNNLFALMLSWRQVRQLLQAIDAASAQSTALSTASQLSLAQLQGAISLRDLSLSSASGQSILEDITLQIQPGEKIAIVGKPGAGKSSLLRVMLGLLQADKGQVLIDGLPLAQIQLENFRRQVGFASQNAQIFSASLRDNVCLRDPDADDAALQEALLLSGYSDLQMQGRGCNEQPHFLSSGTRQSLLLARALLGKPSLLLLDEPSAHLDTVSERMLVQRWRHALVDSTLVLVSHRLPMLALVDRIIVMEGGRITLDGPKEKVLADLQNAHLQEVAS